MWKLWRHQEKLLMNSFSIWWIVFQLHSRGYMYFHWWRFSKKKSYMLINLKHVLCVCERFKKTPPLKTLSEADLLQWQFQCKFAAKKHPLLLIFDVSMPYMKVDNIFRVGSLHTDGKRFTGVECEGNQSPGRCWRRVLTQYSSVDLEF